MAWSQRFGPEFDSWPMHRVEESSWSKFSWYFFCGVFDWHQEQEHATTSAFEFFGGDEYIFDVPFDRIR